MSLLKIAVEKLPPLAQIEFHTIFAREGAIQLRSVNSDIKRSFVSFSGFLKSDCPLVALLKATHAEKSQIVSSS